MPAPLVKAIVPAPPVKEIVPPPLEVVATALIIYWENTSVRKEEILGHFMLIIVAGSDCVMWLSE